MGKLHQAKEKLFIAETKVAKTQNNQIINAYIHK
jgi:hypothetical protein